jgi:nucleotide-binding universal stress UspA family protein
LVIPQVCRDTTEPAAFSRILCGLDFSVCSVEALRYAAALAAQFRARRLVLHVMDLASKAADTRALVPGMGTSWRELEAAAQNRLRAAVPSDVRNTVIVDEVVAVGSAAHEIVHMAKDMDTDLVVIGAQSRAGFELLRFGSVAHAVVRDAPCPVLVIRASTVRAASPTSRERHDREAHAHALAVPA